MMDLQACPHSFCRPRVSSGAHLRWFPIQASCLLQVNQMDANPVVQRRCEDRKVSNDWY